MVSVGSQCEGLEHNFKPPTSISSLVPNFREMCEVSCDLTTSECTRVARPIPVSSAIFDIVTDSSPCLAGIAVVLRIKA